MGVIIKVYQLNATTKFHFMLKIEPSYNNNNIFTTPHKSLKLGYEVVKLSVEVEGEEGLHFLHWEIE